MSTFGKLGTMAILLIAIALAFGSFSVKALDRAHGDYWEYGASTSIDVLGFVADIDGTVTYTFEEKRVLTINLNQNDVNVMSVNGELSGSAILLGQPLLNVSVAVGGFIYETASGGGVVKEDAFMWADATMGSGVVTVTLRFETEDIMTYTPPLLSGFNPDMTRLGDTWIETAVARNTIITWENGVIVNQTSSNETMTFNIAVATSLESITTPAGTFDAERITATDQNGNYDVRWWSNEVGNFVKQESYQHGASTPSDSMILAGYGTRGTGILFLVVLVGVGAAVLAAVVLIVVLITMKRPRNPTSATIQTQTVEAAGYNPES